MELGARETYGVWGPDIPMELGGPDIPMELGAQRYLWSLGPRETYGAWGL